MNRPPPPELRAYERPVRSDYAQERSYARRRITTLIVLVLMIGGAVYFLWSRGPSVPAEIPTIKAEGVYKQKPADPGGIDIPHQDVRVYDELESKTTPPSVPVEHLLPPPETPQPAPHNDAPPATVAPTVAKQVPAALPPPTDPVLSVPQADKVINTTVTPPPAPAPVATVATAPSPAITAPPSKPAPLSIDQVIANTKASASAPAAKTTFATGNVAVQLASVPDEAKAQAMMQSLQQKYAAQLGDASLHLARADLGSRGVYYRIQSQSLAEDDANQICSALKQINAGCILVRK